MSRYLLLLTVFMFSGCAMVPDTLEVPEGTELVSYSKAVTSGASLQGQKARWGGIVVGVENKPNKTFIELAHFPLNHYGKPRSSGETSGRFKVQIDGFVDPIVFEEGRTATFLGTLIAPTTGMVGEQPYIYPTIAADDYHMWRDREVYDVNTFFFNYHSGWYSPFYGLRGPWGWGGGPWLGGSFMGGPWMFPQMNRMRVIRYSNAPRRARITNMDSPSSAQRNNRSSRSSGGQKGPVVTNPKIQQY